MRHEVGTSYIVCVRQSDSRRTWRRGRDMVRPRMNAYRPVPAPRRELSREQARIEVSRFADAMSTRRSIRSFSSEPIDMSLVEVALRIANSAPSGANVQPWHFVVVTNPDVK